MTEQKDKAGGGRRQNARFPRKTAWKAPTAGYETAVFGYGSGATPDTFNKTHQRLTKYVGAGNLDKHGGPEAAAALRALKPPNFKGQKPKAPKATKTEGEKTKEVPYLKQKQYEHDCDEYFKAKSAWNKNNKKIFNLYLSHCSPAMETKLQSMSDWAKVQESQGRAGTCPTGTQCAAPEGRETADRPRAG